MFVLSVLEATNTESRKVHTKPTVGRRAVFVRQPTKFSQCVPHCRLKLVLVGLFSADSTC